MNINEIKKLKAEYINLQTKARNAKTKKTSEKYRDLALDVRRQLSNELSKWSFDGCDFTQFNVMAPVGGPYCVVNAVNFKIESNLGSCLQVSFEIKGNNTRWAGYVHWLDDKCGIDNLAKIA